MSALINNNPRKKEYGMKFDEFARNARNYDENDENGKSFEYFEDAHRRPTPQQTGQFSGAQYQPHQYAAGAPQAGEGVYGANDYMGILNKYEPRSPEDVQVLINYIKQCRYAIVKLDAVPPDDAQRILDFVSGAAYALNGSVSRIEGNIFLVSPQGAEITEANGKKK